MIGIIRQYNVPHIILHVNLSTVFQQSAFSPDVEWPYSDDAAGETE